jgi:hypothetical protein
MNKMILLSIGLISSTALFNLSASAQSLLAGTYACEVVDGKTIEDSRGTITYNSGVLTVTETGKVSLEAFLTVSFKGIKEKERNPILKGSGRLKNLEEGESEESAKAKFSVKPSKTIRNSRINRLLNGQAEFELEAEDLGFDPDEDDDFPDFGDLAVTRTATAIITSKLGPKVELACESSD